METVADVADLLGLAECCVVVGRGPSRDLAPDVRRALGGTTQVVVRDNTAADVAALTDNAAFAQADGIIALGGGRTIDVAKAAALVVDRPLVSCPTQLATDGIASPVAVTIDARARARSGPGRLPAAVVCDLEMAASAPLAATRAGVGDAIANLTALHDWERAVRSGHEQRDDFAALLARAAADLVLASDVSSLEFGPPAPELIGRLLEALVLSGLAMEIAGSSLPCSGAEHLISHSMDRIVPGTALHGEQVAFGTLVAAHLQGQDWQPLRERFLVAGMEPVLAGFGLPEDTLREVIRRAPDTRPARRTVLDHLEHDDAALSRLLGELVLG